MEQGPVLSAGREPLSEQEIVRRLERHRPGRRSSPRGRGETALGRPGETALGLPNDRTRRDRPRGDHDLNPDFYQPDQPLIPAAVLVPIVRRDPLSLLLTRRTDHLHDHAGQVAFPGGRIDPGDADAEAAALRETEEEVGLPRARIEILGRLDTYVTRTGFEVTPIVGLVTPPFPVEPDRFEVAEVFEVPLGFLLDPANRAVHSRIYQGKERQFYAYPYRDYYIWGATAGMLVNLSEILGEAA